MSLNYLFGAYLLIWAGTLVYLFSLEYRQKEVQKALEQALKESSQSK